MANKRRFASAVQLILVILMLLSILLLGQSFNLQYYKIGLILMVVTSLSQIAFGNISPEANLSKAMRYYFLYMGITAALFVVSIVITPYLISLGR